jgi:hypothetical protein
MSPTSYRCSISRYAAKKRIIIGRANYIFNFLPQAPFYHSLYPKLMRQ